MTSKFAAAMRRATSATRAYNLLGATRLIQKTLAKSMLTRMMGQSIQKPATAASGKVQKDSVEASITSFAKPRATSRSTLSNTPVEAKVARSAASAPKATTGSGPEPRNIGRILRENVSSAPSLPSNPASLPSGLATRSARLPAADGASFTSRSFTCKAGMREFRLYVPASAQTEPKGLILMLHGCTQNPDDFALGTHMNATAEAHGLLVAYPHQTRASNASACWNWFEEGHQCRDMGEPGILAGLTRELVSEFGIDETQVFVAGLSAGAAMAVIMAKTYPDVFRAVGVHSGLAYQSAGNVVSAMAVMRGNSGSRLFGKVRTKDAASQPVRTIVFHGSSDRTVHPSNAQQISDMAYGATGQHASVTTSGTSNGRHFKRTITSHTDGTPIVENWLIEGAGHAWSGGTASGSYADAKGPDASAEMVRFFLAPNSLAPNSLAPNSLAPNLLTPK